MKLTPVRRRAAEWLLKNGPRGAIPVEIGLRNVKRLVAEGLAEECGREPGAFGFVKFRITDAGRAALDPKP